MFVTAVRFGPIFVRSEWWFEYLLPHLSLLHKKRENVIADNWLDIEMCLYTWANGGLVGLYDAEGFKFDRSDFQIGMKRNKGLDFHWQAYENTHSLSKKHLNWNVWNVTHLVQRNERDIHESPSEQIKNMRLRLRTSLPDTSSNPMHFEAISIAREVMLSWAEYEKMFDANMQIQLHKQKVNEGN